jgi:hypothetical protein
MSDTATPTPSTWERSTTRRFFKWVFSPRTIRRALVTLAWAAALIALWYGVSDWMARRAWNVYRRGYESRVASLDMKTYIPKAIPDADNFAMNPVALEWTNMVATNLIFSADNFSRANNTVYSPSKAPPMRHFEDLGAWKEALAAAAAHVKAQDKEFRTDKFDLASRAAAAPGVLDGLKDDAEAFDVLRAASGRPAARYPLVYDMENPWAILLPHLTKIKQSCQRLEVRACAELAAGQSENALQDVKLALYVADTIKTEPFIISYLVRIACYQIAARAVWEGLQDHLWSDVQLAQLQTAFSAEDWLAAFELSLHAERAVGAWTMDTAKKKGFGFLSFIDDSQSHNNSDWNSPVIAIASFVAPAAWYDYEKLHVCQLGEQWLDASIDVASKRIYIDKVAAAVQGEEELKGRGILHSFFQHNIMALTLLPAVTRIPTKIATIQVTADEATMACALERFRLAEGHYPDKLEDIVPRFMAQLPKDVLTGEPFKYHLADNGKFVLYSVGWNGKDDGGVHGDTLFDNEKGDWVW